MNLLDSVLSAGDGGVIKQLAGQFGIKTDQTKTAVSALIPALAAGLKEKLTSDPESALSNLITDGSLSRFADDPASLSSPSAAIQGNSILNQIFGGGDLTNIASTVAEKVGVPSSVVTRMLPIATALLGGILARSTAGGQGNLSEILGALATGGHGGLMGAVKGLASKVLG